MTQKPKRHDLDYDLGHETNSQENEQPGDNDRAAIAAAQILQTEQGKFLIAHLRKLTIEKGSIPQQAPDGVAMGMILAYSEGERDLVRKIEQLIERGRNLDVRTSK